LEVPELELSCELRVPSCATLRIGDGILFGTLVWDGRDYALFARRFTRKGTPPSAAAGAAASRRR